MNLILTKWPTFLALCQTKLSKWLQLHDTATTQMIIEPKRLIDLLGLLFLSALNRTEEEKGKKQQMSQYFLYND